MQSSNAQELAGELNKATRASVLAWLRAALSGRERRLPLDRDDPPSLGIERLKSLLNGDGRDNLRSAIWDLLREWLDSDNFPEESEWPEDKIAAVLDLVSEYEPMGAVDLLWGLLQEESRFDALPRTTQICIQNIIEEKIGSLSKEVWDTLVGRDPGRFGVTAFGAMARFDLDAALRVLPDLPGEPEVLYALEFRTRWLLSILPAERRQNALAQISQTLIQTQVPVRECLRAAFKFCGAPLPEPLLPNRVDPGLRDFLQELLGPAFNSLSRTAKLAPST